MAIKHVVRCDGPKCGREEPLTASATTQVLDGLPQSSYLVPSEWKEIDGRQFCSWRCLALDADLAWRQGKR